MSPTTIKRSLIKSSFGHDIKRTAIKRAVDRMNVWIISGVRGSIFNSGVLLEGPAPETAAAQRLEDAVP